MSEVRRHWPPDVTDALHWLDSLTRLGIHQAHTLQQVLADHGIRLPADAPKTRVPQKAGGG